MCPATSLAKNGCDNNTGYFGIKMDVTITLVTESKHQFFSFWFDFFYQNFFCFLCRESPIIHWTFRLSYVKKLLGN